MQHKCPHCGSVVYSRRNVLCGVCGKRLPDSVLFTAEERTVVERELAEAKRRARQARAADGIGGGDAGGYGGGDFGGDCGGGGD
jgi:uncharacterized Zn finger protein (UPF0148 family)